VSPPAIPWYWFLTAEILQLLPLNSSHHRFSLQNCLNSQLTLSLACNTSAQTTQKHQVSIVVGQLLHY
jgi:hypothetical protein